MFDDEENESPPKDLEAERFVIGVVLQDEQCFAICAAKLCVEDFYPFGQYKQLWRRIVEYKEFDCGPLDVVTLNTYLNDCEETPELRATMRNCAEAFVHTRAADFYATRVRKTSLQRQLLRLRLQIHQKIFKDDPADVLNELRRVVDELTGKLPGSLYEPVSVISARVVESIYDRVTNKKEVQGVPSGLIDLDRMTGGFRPGQMIMVGARPGMGKTQFALNLCHLPAFRPGGENHSALFFTLEMGKEEIVERLLSQLSGVPFDCIKNGNLGESDVLLFENGLKLLNKLQLTLLDSNDNVNTVQKLEARIRSLPTPPRIILIDYLSYLKGASTENKNLEVEEICHDLKTLAVRLGIPIVLLVQVSRELERRADKRPMLSDFRDSGGVEQTADIAIFLYREGYYSPEVSPNNVAEIIIGKQRNGATGTVYTDFNAAIGVFFDRADKSKPHYTKGDGEPDKPSRSGSRYRSNSYASHTIKED